jgi:hypothetical protein
MIEFAAGVLVMGHLIAGLFFLRFWARTGDRFFVMFACAFWLLALTQTLLALAGMEREEQTWFYLIRLAAFVLIIVAIIAKNMGVRR